MPEFLYFSLNFSDLAKILLLQPEFYYLSMNCDFSFEIDIAGGLNFSDLA